MRRSSGLFAFAALAAFYACGSSDDSTTTRGADGDDGGGSDASASADAAPRDAAPSDGSVTTDGGGADGGSLIHTGIITCDAPFRVDTAGGAQGGVAVVASGDHALVGWHDAKLELRPVDGTTLGSTLSLGTDVNFVPFLVADPNGHAYAQWMNSAVAGQRAIYSFAAASFGATTPFTATGAGDTSYDALAGTKSGALSVYPSFATGVGGEQSTGSSWSAAGVSSVGTTSTAYGLRSAAAYGGDARAVIYYSFDLGMLTLHVFASSGGATWTQATRTISATIPYAGGFALAVYANGDPFVAWDDKNGELVGARYRVGTATWDPDQTIDTYDVTPTAAGATTHLTIDDSDHLTVSWTYASDASTYHTYYRRDVGAGLGVRKTLSASPTTTLVVDRVGTTYLLTAEKVGDAGTAHVAVRRAGVGEPIFADAADTGIVATTSAPTFAPEPAAVAFDGANEPIVVGLDANPSLIPANGVSAARCH
ncbi:MAG: hypothetical protein ABI551_06820 [Polyangiaceae bacterium]